MSESVTQQVFQVVSDVFGIPAAAVTRDTSSQTVDGWDSVQHLNFMLALETSFGVQFEPEEIEQLQNVGAAVDLVQRKTQV